MFQLYRLTVVPFRFDETRFQDPTEEQNRAFTPFGLGSRSCLGMNLAKMELRIGAALFFREFRGCHTTEDMTDNDMTVVTRFFAYPKSQKCNITLPRN